jgi:ABC-type nitrate/sulfonate/bicarbonate transport system ATPase subunit
MTIFVRRVNIARALYDNSAEVFLLDDPLSAGETSDPPSYV